jgi:tetratricopeptide (TPR) repeat protein
MYPVKQLSSLIVSCLAALVVAGVTFPASAAERCPASVARSLSVQGSLEVRYAGQTHWQTVSRNDEFCPDDALRTGADSRAAIQLFPETVIRLDQFSSMVFSRPETATSPSWLELIKGAAHFISRDPRALKIITPFANAAIEGTEFLVQVAESRTDVTVYEGRVLVDNTAGSVGVGSGEQASAQAGVAPVKQVVVRPLDAVQWSLYYPPVLFSGEPALQQAAEALGVGRVDTATALLGKVLQQDAGNSDALALQSIIALTMNDKATALELARSSIARAPESATAAIALSYAQQAHFDLSGALGSLQGATRHEPANALAWARLAELWLSVGDIDQGVSAAEHASALAPATARAWTVLGFAYLTKISIPAAMQAFEKAITLDQAAPLPRLGLGLAKIRKGKRDQLAATQYEMARELDPNDPTPWFYDAIRKQTENRPVEALHDLQTSIKLNDNRAVYRSRLELDADLATRSAGIARIYRDLGFEQRALVDGWQSVNTDPTNYSAHRLLADSYATQPRHEIARVSELLQSQLLQPINLTPVQPQLAETNLFILEGAGPSDATFQEFNPLFTRNRLALQANGIIGGNDTLGDDLVHNGVHDNWSWSVGQFHYETDGYRDNNDQEQDIYNLFVQGTVTHKTSVQAELRHKETESGDLLQRFEPDNFLPTERRTIDTDSARLGLHHVFSPRSEVIASAIWQDREEDLDSDVPFAIPFVGSFVTSARLDDPRDGYTLELQHLYRAEALRLVSGAGYFDADGGLSGSVVTSPPPPGFLGIPASVLTSGDLESNHRNAYLYAYLPYGDDLTVTVGASYDELDLDETSANNIDGFPVPASRASLDLNEFNPKLGLSWQVSADTTLRAAAFRAVKRSLISNQTVEPTQVAGFNQFYDDATGTKSRRYGIGLDHTISTDLAAGAEYSWRDLEVPYLDTVYKDVDWEERSGRAYLYWTPHPRLAASMEYQYERFARDQEFTGEILATNIRTHKLPLALNYFHPRGYIARLRTTYIDQQGDFASGPGFVPGAPTTEKDDQFWVVDASLGYRLPKRRGLVSLGISNLFDEDFKYVDTDPFNPRIYPERLVFGRFTLAF